MIFRLTWRLLIGLMLISNISLGQEPNILLRTDFDGKITTGSIEILIEAINQGHNIKIGWQLDFNNDKIPDLEHWVNSSFLTIMNGQVFDQIGPIYAQIPNSDIPQVQITNSSLKWTAIIGTNGKLLSRYILEDLNEIKDPEYRMEMEKMLEPSEQQVQTIWIKN